MREFKRKSRVLLIDDNADHLRGVKELITLESSYEVVSATTSANMGISLAKKYRPDIILMDINMPEKDGLQAIQEIEKLYQEFLDNYYNLNNIFNFNTNIPCFYHFKNYCPATIKFYHCTF